MRRGAALVLLLAASAFAEDHGAGIAVLASGIGHGQSVDDVAAFAKVGRFRHVVVDWAWITAHWERTDFAAVEALVKKLKTDGVEVAAMYRPRFFATDDVRVPFQVGPDGKPADASHREICFESAEARAWGAKWAAEILEKCPSLDEVTVYNPRLHCECAACTAARKKDPDAAIAATKAFLAEVRDGMRKVRKDARLAVVSNPEPAWFEALKDVIDVARPYVFCTDAADPVADFAAAAKVRASARAAGPALAKITWGEGDRMTDAKLAAFIKAGRDTKVPFVFWTYDSAFLEGTYDLDALCAALGVDPKALKPIVKHLGGKVVGAGGKPEPADPKEIKAAIDAAKEKFQAEAGALWQKVAQQFGEQAVEAVASVLSDDTNTIEQRWMAAWCLEEIASPKAAAALLDASRDESWAIRYYAAEALGACGREEPKAAARLKEMAAKDPFTQPDANGKDTFPVRDVAAASLKKLAAPPPEKPGPPAETCLDRLPWCATVEEALRRAKAENRIVLAFVIPFENAHFEDGYEGAAAVRAATPLNTTEEQARDFETGFVKERAILTALLGEPRTRSVAARRFVLVKLRLGVRHFPGKGPVPDPDPLALLGTTCSDTRGPAVVFSGPDGKLIRRTHRIGTFNPEWFRRLCVQVLNANRNWSGLDEVALAAVEASRAKPEDLGLRRARIEELLASGADDDAIDAGKWKPDSWDRYLTTAEVMLLCGDVNAAATVFTVKEKIPEELRAAHDLLLATVRMRQGKYAEAAKLLDHPPKLDRAEYLAGLLADLTGRRDKAEEIWGALLARAPVGPFSALAQLRLSRKGPYLEEWMTASPSPGLVLVETTEHEDDDGEPVPAVVDWLLAQQRPDGGWRNPSYPVDPADPNAEIFDYTVPRSALVARALQAALPRLDKERKAKATAAIAKASELIGSWSDHPREFVWHLTYALDFEGREWAAAKGDAKKTAARRVENLLDALAKIESNGGWSYMPPPRLHVFNTAPILLELAELKQAGWAVDAGQMKRAAAFLEQERVGDKAVFHYGSAMEHLTSEDQPEGSSMRSPLAELALHAGGFTKDPKRLREALDLFFDNLDAVRSTAKINESFFDASVMHDAYHYFFGCWYAARAIRLLPEKERAPLAKKLLAKLEACQEIDGSFVDAQMVGKGSSTALALLAILECMDLAGRK